MELFGPADKYLRKIRDAMDVNISARKDNITIVGKTNHVKNAAKIIALMEERLTKKDSLADDDIDDLLEKSKNKLNSSKSDVLSVYSGKGVIEPLSKGQKEYINTMLTKDLTFCIGPAGTGKTYLAVAVAVAMLKKRQIRKIVLARPAVEAGERLGFLPGDIQAKVNPYLRPLFDSIEDMMDFTQTRKFIEMDIIEIIPLAFMRGRTFNEAAVICDEAQNTSTSQMMMFLTRLGRGSKMIVTGDITQVDLEKNQVSGMVDASETLKGIEGIGFVELHESDIIRHDLVQNIVQAYEKRKKQT